MTRPSPTQVHAVYDRAHVFARSWAVVIRTEIAGCTWSAGSQWQAAMLRALGTESSGIWRPLLSAGETISESAPYSNTRHKNRHKGRVTGGVGVVSAVYRRNRPVSVAVARGAKMLISFGRAGSLSPPCRSWLAAWAATVIALDLGYWRVICLRARPRDCPMR